MINSLFNDNKFIADLNGKTFICFGDFSTWPEYFHGESPTSIMSKNQAVHVEKITADVDYIIIGEKRAKGKAEALRKAKKLEIEVLDQATFFYNTRPNIKKSSFSFAGGFVFLPELVNKGQNYSVLQEIDCEHHAELNSTTNFLVLGEKRAKGKAAAEKKAYQQNSKIIGEQQFLDLIANQLNPEQLNFQSLVVKLQATIDPNRVQKALQMLKTEGYSLFSEHDAKLISGIVSSQTGTSSGYSCMIKHDGSYSCCCDDQYICWGMQGNAICKHILVLLLGLVQTSELDAVTVFKWIQSTIANKPTENDESMNLLAKTWLRYKGAMAGELDWRPMETIPEDYYAF